MPHRPLSNRPSLITRLRASRGRRGPRTAAAALLLILSLALPSLLAAHTALRSASPADGDSLSAVPEAIRLSFTTPVQLGLSSLTLTGPDGADVELATLAAGDSDNELLAGIVGPFTEGSYLVRWQTVSADGHPVRGEFSFVVEPGAEGLAVAAPAPDPAAAEPATPAPQPAAAPTVPFDVGSPLYAAVRWLTFLGLLGAIGAVAFRAPVLALVSRDGDAGGRRMVEPAARTAALIGFGAGALLVGALAMRLFAQSYAVFGAGPMGDGRAGALLGQSTWGTGWLLQAAGALLALVGFWLARRGIRGGWVAAGMGTVVLGFSSALSGHAAASDASGLAVLADALHVLGAGGWMGSLLAVVLVGIPAALRLPAEERGAAVRSLVNAFSPAALAFAAVVVATGVFASWLHLQSLPALWESAYGRTLLLKLAALSVVFAAGAYNWRRVRPALGTEVGAHRLRRSASVELAAGALVLAVTAVLVATPPPAESEPAPAVAVER